MAGGELAATAWSRPREERVPRELQHEARVGPVRGACSGGRVPQGPGALAAGHAAPQQPQPDVAAGAVRLPRPVVQRLRGGHLAQLEELPRLWGESEALRELLARHLELLERMRQARRREAELVGSAACVLSEVEGKYREVQCLRFELAELEARRRASDLRQAAVEGALSQARRALWGREAGAILRLELDTGGLVGLCPAERQRSLKLLSDAAATSLSLPATTARCISLEAASGCTSVYLRLPQGFRAPGESLRQLTRQVTKARRSGALIRHLQQGLPAQGRSTPCVHSVSEPELLDGAELVTPETAGPIGFTPHGEPPQTVLLRQVEPGSWAELLGLRGGDRLLWLNGRPASEAGASEVAAAAREARPLRLYVCRPAGERALQRKREAAALVIQCSFRGRKARGEAQAARQRVLFQRQREEEHAAALQRVRGEEAAVARRRREHSEATAALRRQHDEVLATAMHRQQAEDAAAAFQMQLEEEAATSTQGQMGEELAARHRRLRVEEAGALRKRLEDEADAARRQLEEETVARRREIDKEVAAKRGEEEAAAARWQCQRGVSAQAGPAELVVVARASDGQLGIQRAGSPPLAVFVAHVAAGSWAECSGMAVGDELAAVNGCSLAEMSEPDLLDCLQHTRPLQLTLLRGSLGAHEALRQHAAATALQTAWRARLAQQHAQLRDERAAPHFSPEWLPPGPVLAETLGASTWLERSGIMQDRPLELVPERAGGAAAASAEVGAATQDAAACRIQAHWRGRQAREDVAFQRRCQDTAGRLRAVGGVDSLLTELMGPCGGTQDERGELGLQQEQAAAKIQAVWRGARLREDVELLKGFTVVAAHDDARLGFKPEGAPPRHVTVKSVDANSWAERSGVRAGDKLLSVNGQRVKALPASEFMACLESNRPLTLILMPASHDGQDAGGQRFPRQRYCVSAGVEETRLGFRPAGTPPQPVRVRSVEPGGWAERWGVLAGDQLLAVSGKAVEGMAEEDLLSCLESSRPLRLAFLRSSDAPTPPPPAPKPTPGGGSQAQQQEARSSALGPRAAVAANSLAGPEARGPARGERPAPVVLQRTTAGAGAAEETRAQVVAACRIQAQWRGRQAREDVAFQRRCQDAASQLQAVEGVDALLAELIGPEGHLQEDWGRCERQHESAAKAIQTSWRLRQARQAAAREQQQDAAAASLQAAWRGRQARQQAEALRVEHSAASSVQAAWRGQQARRKVEILRLEHSAATSVQAAWRGRQVRVEAEFRLQQEQAAAKIQAAWRGARLRAEVEVLRGFTVVAAHDDTRLGFKPKGAPPRHVTVKSIDANGWAERSGVRVGDKLLSVNGRLVKALPASEFVACLESKRPLTLTIMPQDAEGQRFPRRRYCVSVVEETRLGFKPAGTPPQPVRVQSVEPGGWAERWGVLAGDQLLAISGKAVEGMEEQDLLSCLESARPLRLAFLRSSDAPAPPPRAPEPALGAAAGSQLTAETRGSSELQQRALARGSVPGPGPGSTMPGAGRSGRGARPSCAVESPMAFERESLPQLASGAQRESVQPSTPQASEASGGRPCIEPLQSGQEQFTAVAGEGVEQLGFTPAGWPPATVLVKSVDRGSWADKQGVEAGDRLLAANGVGLHLMDKASLRRVVAQRPLALRFSRARGAKLGAPSACDGGGLPGPREEPPTGSSARDGRFVAVAQEGQEQLGFARSGWPPGRVLVKSVDAGSWAEQSGIASGDALLAVNGSEVSLMSKEALKAAVVARPLQLEFARPPSVRAPTPLTLATLKPLAEESVGSGWKGYDVQVSEDVERLGFVPKELPKGAAAVGPIIIQVVDSGSWADRNGIAVGDRLVTINGQVVDLMGDKEVRRWMRGRPLQLTFSRMSPLQGASREGQALSFVAPLAHEQPVEVVEEQVPTQLEALAAKSGRKLEFTAYDGENDLGFKTDYPPDPCIVRKVTPTLWAELSGIKVGYELVSVNGKRCEGMTKDKLKRALERRPVTLKFQRPRKQPNAGVWGAFRAAALIQ